MFFTFGSIMRLMAIIRIYSSGVTRLCTPLILASSVSTSWKVHGIKARNPFAFSGFLACTSLMRARCINRSSIVSTWPNIMVALVVMLSLCASCITASHSSAPHLPLLIRRRTRSISISAPAPGKLSSPAACNCSSVSRWLNLPSLAMWATSGGPSACSFRVGYSCFISRKVFV